VTLKQILKLDWDAIAGIIAAVTAIVMHLLHLIHQEVLLTIAVVLIALLFLRDLRRERQREQLCDDSGKTLKLVRQLRAELEPREITLVGPNRLRGASEAFCRQARGEMIWFHVCLSMFRPQALFDVLLRPALENPAVESIQFILDEGQQELWASQVLPKIGRCPGAEKVRPPQWNRIQESVSLIIAGHGTGDTECLLSFWGEPFMAHVTEREVPRYIFHVHGHSGLINHLVELVRGYRFAS